MNKVVFHRCFQSVIVTSLLLVSVLSPSRAQNNNITLVGKVFDKKTGVALPGAE